MKHCWFILAWVWILNSFSGHCRTDKSPPIEVSLEASWNAPPFLLEVIESLSEVGLNAFTFLRTIIDTNPSLLTDTPKNIYDYVVTKNSLHLGENNLDIVRVSLGVHLHSPRIQAFYHYFEFAVNATLKTACGHDVFELGSSKTCVLDELDLNPTSKAAPFKPLPIDHSYANKLERALVAYVDVLDKEFQRTFKKLLQIYAANEDLNIVLRWRPNPLVAAKTLFLSGYGAELALKSTEYKVTDDQVIVESSVESSDEVPKTTKLFGFDFDELGKRYPGKDFTKFKDSLVKGMDEIPQIKPLNSTQLAGLKLATFALSSPAPLVTLRRMLEDYPLFASFLTAQSINEDLEQEVKANQQDRIAPGTNALWINGLEVEVARLDPFSLITAFRLETQAVLELETFGLEKKKAIELLSGSQAPTSANSPPKVEGFYDIRESQGATVWWNDLEKDSRYKHWPTSLMALLSFDRSEELPPIRRNIFNCLIVLDLSVANNLKIVVKMFDIISKRIPIRFGLIPYTSDESETITRLYYFYDTFYGKKGASDFLKELSQQTRSVDFNILKDVFNKINLANKLKKDLPPATSFEDVIKPNWSDEIEKRFVGSVSFCQRFGVGSIDPVTGKATNGAIFANAQYMELNDNFLDMITHAFMPTLNGFQRMIYFGQISDSVNTFDLIHSQSICKTSRNPYITVTESTPVKVINMAEIWSRDFEEFKYVHLSNQNVSDSPSVTMWLVGDGNHPALMKTFFASLHLHLNTSYSAIKAKLRVAYVSTVPVNIETFMENARKNGYFDEKSLLFSAEEIKELVSSNIANDELNAKIKQGYMVIANGRLIGPLPNNYALSSEDLIQIADTEAARFGRLYRKLTEFTSNFKYSLETTEFLASSIILSINSKHVAANTVSAYGSSTDTLQRTESYSLIRGKYSAIEQGDPDRCSIFIVAAVGVLTKESQKLITVLESFSQLDRLVRLRIYLNPDLTDHEDLPLKRFYRYQLDIEPTFADKDGLQRRKKLIFDNIPIAPLLTLGMDVIQPWVVSPIVSPYDLDNIRLSSLEESVKSRGIQAEFQLKYVLVEGHCRDARTGSPPRGLQFDLGVIGGAATADTIVMANLGYFQLKAGPGIWKFSLRSGKSSTVYELLRVNSGETEYTAKHGYIDVVVSHFSGALLFTAVTRKPGMEKEELLVDTATDKSSNIWNKVYNWAVGGDQNTNQTAKTNAEINIFSVASGHLYERFLRIMILSVMKQTKSTVKFWFIENFLSPLFKDFIPYMAKEVGFEYELVTYKWPQWLRAQSEKQRMIWGYKILFLDVLFPLDLDKVIFVDADQIVRTDLKELVDMDLMGAPYGYTPFCESRKEIEGFRFWKIGYWKNHLNGKPYHISALYVVDLHRFRQLAAGDRLRQQYQSLSADPNSLANLDQDLPNDMQHIVPIFSLPNDWLWCETWCSDESLKTAKTIDLCNNPMTKEAKLDRAKRLLPEWTVFDDQAKALFDVWQKQKTVPSITPSFQASMVNTNSATHDEL